MKVQTKARILAVSLITLLGTFAFPALTFAAVDTCTWTGVINANWSNGGNWTGCDNGGVPQNGDSLIFASGALSSTNDMAGLSIATLSISAAQTISGNAFTVTGGFSNSTAAAVINANITLGGNQSFASTASGSVNLGGNLNLNGFNLTTLVNGGGMSISGVISGAGSILKSGTDSLALLGNNTFSANLSITGGAVNIYNSNALGNTVGTTTVSSGATINIFINGLTVPENITIDGSGNVGGGALRNFTGASTWSGDITIGAGNT